MTSVGKSVKNKIRKFVKGGGRHSKSNIQSSTSSRMVPSGSFPSKSLPQTIQPFIRTLNRTTLNNHKCVSTSLAPQSLVK